MKALSNRSTGHCTPRGYTISWIVQSIYLTVRVHLSVQGLRLAFDHMIGSRFEDMVREADVAETLAAGGSPPPAGTKKASGGAVQTAEMTLLRRPAVFTLAIVWDSPQVRA